MTLQFYPFSRCKSLFQEVLYFLTWNWVYFPETFSFKKAEVKNQAEYFLAVNIGALNFSKVIFSFFPSLVFVGCCDIKTSNPVSRKPRGKFVVWVALEGSSLAYTINLRKVCVLYVGPIAAQRGMLWFLQARGMKCRCALGRSVCSSIVWILSLATLPPPLFIF